MAKKNKNKNITPSRANEIISNALAGMAVIIEVRNVLSKNNLSKKIQSKVLHTLADEIIKNKIKI